MAIERLHPVTGSGSEGSALDPLRHPLFRALWMATVVSNVGTWVQSTAAAWLMTSLSESATMVALMQTASSLPIFLLAMPAGVLADTVDRRCLILATQTWMLLMAAALGGLAVSGLTTPALLLAFTFLLSLGHALNAPVWQVIIPDLVPVAQLPGAVALNSASFNMARAVGPALGGLVVGLAGAGSAFFINSASFLGVLGVIYLWKGPERGNGAPPERMVGAMVTGLRYVVGATALRGLMLRAGLFIFCGSALMALLPLLVIRQLGLGSLGYGLLLGCFGLGAVLGAALLPLLRRRMAVDQLINQAMVLFAAVEAAAAWVSHAVLLGGLLMAAGAAWLTILASFNATVQTAVPAWVRGRTMAVYMLVFFGGVAMGSTVWGAVASHAAISLALPVACLAMVVGLLTTANHRLAAISQAVQTPEVNPNA